jgi:hypothetical protein
MRVRIRDRIKIRIRIKVGVRSQVSFYLGLELFILNSNPNTA